MDLSLAIIVQKLGSQTFIDTLSMFISSKLILITFVSAIYLAILILDKKNRKKIITTTIIATLLHLTISEGLFKTLLPYFDIIRLRPYLAHPDLTTAIGHLNTSVSFPSSHMSALTAVSTILASFYKKTWPFAILAVLIMGFSRIHNGMHYPTDVIGGAILGILYAIIATKIAKKFQ